MSRTLLRVAAWAAATLLAMAMSWLGVHSVFSADASGDAPQAIPIAAPSSPSPTPSPELAPPTSTAPVTSAPSPTSSPSSSAAASSSAVSPATSSSAEQTADVRSYQLTGGRVVLEMTPASARLVSATPDEGWQVQAWQADGWLRVDFSRDGTTSSCFVTWNGHPPTVQTT